ncbi:hypothetical protein ETB97_002412 [Aspergillus alliaceus]|uniref:Xylanolytic transcriptional activator regulatory domain-containing protein n=1 Tax=Petromyces alliaceus TaxID=209559 RepID=A0A8H6E618_PETAA|nr:hypothetical protein ETB97_002412 [Aspergillus burnettii]
MVTLTRGTPTHPERRREMRLQINSAASAVDRRKSDVTGKYPVLTVSNLSTNRLEESLVTLSRDVNGRMERPVSPVELFSPPALGSTADASDVEPGGDLVDRNSRKDQLAGGAVPGRQDVVSEGRGFAPLGMACSATANAVRSAQVTWHAVGTSGVHGPSVNSPPFLHCRQNRSVLSGSPETRNTLLFGLQHVTCPLLFIGSNTSQQRVLWQSYLDNVAPLVSIMHRRTLEELLTQASKRTEVINKPRKAILLAVYLSAITSMTPAQCLDKLGERQEEAIHRYRLAVENALTQADFINSHSLELLQSAVLYLICVRRLDQGSFAWTMLAIVLRLAQRLELDRESTLSAKTPITTEMSRRLWWHIVVLDVQCAEDHRTEPMVQDGQYDTRFPLNINDNDLVPGATEFPRERFGFTDMTFSLIRFQIAAAYLVLKRSSTTHPNASMEDMVTHRQQLVTDLEQRLYEKYLKSCNPAIAMHSFCCAVSQLVLSKLRLYVYNGVSPGGTPTTESMAKIHEFLFATSVDIIELSVFLETSQRDTGNWSWVFKNNNQWNAVAFALAELCVRVSGPDVDRAWLAITSAYNLWNWRDAKGTWPAIPRLTDRALQARRNLLGLARNDGSAFTRDYCRPWPEDLRPPPPKRSQGAYHPKPSSTLNHSYNMSNAPSSLVNITESDLSADSRFGDLLEDDIFSNFNIPPNTILGLF